MALTYAASTDPASWGRVVRNPQTVASARFLGDLPALLKMRPTATVLPVGCRRSYGDSVVNSDGCIISMTQLNRFISLDTDSMLLRAEAGTTLNDVITRIVPLGYFIPVTPGTRFVSLGGAIANDVHGKNHHRAGTFGRHISRLELLRSDGTRLEIGPELNEDLFRATIGGLGLTGIITWVELKLQRIQSSVLDVDIVPFGNLSEFWDLALESSLKNEHTVAWIDCTARGHRAGRGIFSRADWRGSGELIPHRPKSRIRFPFEAPTHMLNRFTVGAFNYIYYAAGSLKSGRQRQSYGNFFYPLDGIANWNLIYGRRGFWQYQCVLPTATMKDATSALLAEIARSGQGSFLAVLKTFGALTSPGILSFPMEGTTLALDFPNLGQPTLALLDRLDVIVREAGGRLYAAKDGRISRTMWQTGYQRMAEFLPHVDPAISSDFARRIGA